jgi:hypothetical protein
LRESRNRLAGRTAAIAAAIIGAPALFSASLLPFYAWYGFSSYITRYVTPMAAVITISVACLFAQLTRASLLTRAIVGVGNAIMLDVLMARYIQHEHIDWFVD